MFFDFVFFPCSSQLSVSPSGVRNTLFDNILLKSKIFTKKNIKTGPRNSNLEHYTAVHSSTACTHVYSCVLVHTHSGALSSAKTIAAVLNLVLDYYSSQAMSYYKSYFINSPLKFLIKFRAFENHQFVLELYMYSSMKTCCVAASTQNNLSTPPDLICN